MPATGLLCAVAAPLLETNRFEVAPGPAARLLAFSLAATALFLGSQNFAQGHTTPSRAAVAFASQPACAALFGWIAGETIEPHGIVGAVIVPAGVRVSTVSPRAGG